MIQAVRPAPVQQHGAMEFTEPPVDLNEIRLYRLQRVRAELEKHDYAAIVLYDPINIRYATDIANMQVWCMHNENRYVFVPVDGPVVLFEIDGCSHLAKGMPTVDEIRPPKAWYFFNVGPRYPEIAELWAMKLRISPESMAPETGAWLSTAPAIPVLRLWPTGVSRFAMALKSWSRPG